MVHARLEDLNPRESALEESLDHPAPAASPEPPCETGSPDPLPSLRAGAAAEREWPSSSEIDGGPVLAAETARRLACTARIQAILENGAGDPIGLGRLTREPAEWMLRQLRHRDGGCTFPGCGNRRYAHAHHIEWWSAGGRTDLENLALVCAFHHKLVHQYGWRMSRSKGGAITWFRPDGTEHVAGPSEPRGTAPQLAAMPP